MLCAKPEAELPGFSMTSAPVNQDLYSYPTVENLGPHGTLSLQFFRRQYRRKAALLLLLLPFDLVYLLALSFCWRRPRRYMFLSRMSVDLLGVACDGRDSIILGSASELLSAMRRGALWIPVSPLYIALAWSKWTVQGAASVAVKVMVAWFARLLLPRFAPKAWLIVHSDALPLARALIAIARTAQARVCCLQHGIFDPQYVIPEIDGSQSDLNVVRSTVDAGIIRRANSTTRILVEPDLFRPLVSAAPTGGPNVLLIGEGWHTCDAQLDRLYRARLREVEAALADRGIPVTFRPHPSERYRAWRYGFRHIDRKKKGQSLRTFNVYVGFASTLLNEAAMCGHLAIQVVFEGRLPQVIARTADQHVVQADSVSSLVQAVTERRMNPSVPSDGSAQRRNAVDRVLAALQAEAGSDLSHS